MIEKRTEVSNNMDATNVLYGNDEQRIWTGKVGGTELFSG